MRANHRVHSRGAGSTTRMEARQAPSERKNSFGALADNVVSEEHQSEKECSMCAERTGSVRQETLINPIAGIPGLIEDTLAVLVTVKVTTK